MQTWHLATLTLALLTLVPHIATQSIQKVSWGNIDGKEVFLFTLTNRNNLKVNITNYGGIVTSLLVPDSKGNMGDIVLGFDNLSDYVTKSPYFGALIGRYANRIAQGIFKLDGKTYQLAVNDPPNHLHGGNKGFDKRVWKIVSASSNPNEASLSLNYVSLDGEENYPGTLNVTVTYTLSNDNNLKIDYHGETDSDTIINLTNHSYFNLAAGKATDILSHFLQLYASTYTPVDYVQIPTGEIVPVEDTPMDFFSLPYSIGSRIVQVSGGYDHNYVVNEDEAVERFHQSKKEWSNKFDLKRDKYVPFFLTNHQPSFLKHLASQERKLEAQNNLPIRTRSRKFSTGFYLPVATLFDPSSSRLMSVFSTQPGVQFYSGNKLDGSLVGKYNITYPQHYGLCLEAQHFPDSPNEPSFPSTVLRKGETYQHSTIYQFLQPSRQH